MGFPTFTITQLAGSLTANFYDTSTWGVSPAPLQSEVTAAVMTVSLPDVLTKMPDPTNTVIINMFAKGYPFTSPISLTSVDFGQSALTDKTPDGVYSCSLLVTFDTGGGEETITGVWNAYFYMQNNCCADNMSNSRACGCDECLTHKEINLFKMRLNFFAISLNERFCQNNDAAALAIIDSTELCDGRTCKSCGC